MIVEQEKPPTNGGFVKNYEYTLSWQSKSPGWKIYSGAGPKDIMAMHTPETLPVLSTLARQYAVCDRWFCSAPTQPNRAFLHLATSEGIIKNNWNHVFTSKSIYKALQDAGRSWGIYSFDQKGLSMIRFDIQDILHAPDSHFGVFDQFVDQAKSGKLPHYTFLEPAWGQGGNSMHPNYNVANGEQYLYKAALPRIPRVALAALPRS